MHVIIFMLTLFLAPTPEHKDVQVEVAAKVMPSPEACVAMQQIVMAQAHQDPRILNAVAGCFTVDGDVGQKS